MSVRFVLASSSPRRRELLGSIGADFDVIPSNIPEERGEGETPEEYVARLSREKAHAIAAKHPDRWIIAADTTGVGIAVMEMIGQALGAKADGGRGTDLCPILITGGHAVTRESTGRASCAQYWNADRAPGDLCSCHRSASTNSEVNCVEPT